MIIAYQTGLPDLDFHFSLDTDFISSGSYVRLWTKFKSEGGEYSQGQPRGHTLDSRIPVGVDLR